MAKKPLPSYTVVTARFPADVYEKLKEEAEKNRRSISAQLIFLTEQQLLANA